ncbi:MAG: sugar phosphate isomerase/epimerase family protein [Bryobacteraceae bacterium]
MAFVTRRNFVGRSLISIPFASALIARERFTANNLGVQLYTVRSTVGKDPLGVLRRIQEIGYKEIEATSGNLQVVAPALKQTTLRPVSIHIEEGIFMGEGAKLDEAFANAKSLGFKFAVVPYIAPEHRGGAEVFKALADKLNKFGEKANANGLRLCYHNHAFEYQTFDGKTGLEMLMSGTDKNLVGLELDIFWASVAGQNPVDVLKRYSGRVPLVHLKDKSKSFGQMQYNEKVPKDTFKEVGNGSIDIASVLKSAEAEGAEHYFVEQDQTTGDPLDSLATSYKNLSAHFD